MDRFGTVILTICPLQQADRQIELTAGDAADTVANRFLDLEAVRTGLVAPALLGVIVHDFRGSDRTTGDKGRGRSGPNPGILRALLEQETASLLRLCSGGTVFTGADGTETWFSWLMAQSDEKSERRERSGDRSRENRPVISAQVIGSGVVLLILAAYFAWMIIEMGGHAVPRAWPMVGVVVAAVAGSIAATLGMIVGRRGNHTDRD